ncbi:MAG: hypothetical protein ACYDIB_03285 [Desulfobulbia bacterium]|jgi:hypothetical protein
MKSLSGISTGRFFGALTFTPRVLLFVSVLTLFPFISTVTGASLKIGGMEIWKYLWLLWLGGLSIYIFLNKSFFDKWGGRVETVLWVFIAFMLVFSPKADLVIDPWKNWFFCLLTLILFRFFAMADAEEIKAMIKSTLGFWWFYALILIVYAKSVPYYPGSIQHQFFLSGLLGLVAGLLMLSRYVVLMPVAPVGRGLHLFFLVTVIVNVILNLSITETRSVFPFSLALVLIAATWLFKSSIFPAPKIAWFGFPLAFLITLLPLLHLSGSMGNLVNELAYPVFGKLRTVESKTGREAAFQVWSGYVVNNSRLLGPASGPMPNIEQEHENPAKPLFGMSRKQFNELKERGKQTQEAFAERQRDLGVDAIKPEQRAASSSDLQGRDGNESSTPLAQKGASIAPVTASTSIPAAMEKIAITSSHNQWLDAAARSGLVYAVAIAWAFGYVVWLISFRLAPSLPMLLLFAYWTMTVAWGFASQFDDEHWLYHIPYLTLFFIPMIVSARRIRDVQPVPA